MVEYQVFGINVVHPDARQASELMKAALAGDRLARQALADLIEEHGDPIFDHLPGLVRSSRNALISWNDGSVNLVRIDDEGSYRYVWQIGWNLPVAQDYQQPLDGDMPLVVHEPSPLDNAF